MNSKEIREKFLEYFEKQGHKIVPSSSLLSDDPSVLLTTAGMQQFKPYYTNPSAAQDKYGSVNVVSVQKTFRTSDIDEVGNESHLTFFEMLGNFSFGDYFKEKAIKYGYDFIVKELGLKIDYVSVFEGDKNIPADTESEEIWKSIDPDIEVKKFNRKENFWGPTGNEGPCGPTSEIYVDGIEIWNLVFNEYLCHKDGSFTKLDFPGVDTGMGLERLAMVVQKKKTIFETDLFGFILNKMSTDINEEKRRIVADHLRGIVFLISDGVLPSNKEAGYILRRLIRRVISYDINSEELLKSIVGEYKDFYSELNEENILSVYREENERFSKTLKKGLRELDKLTDVDTKSAFNLYQSFGLPYEVIKDSAGEKAKNLKREDFDKELEKHQEISRAGAGTFKGGLADDNPQTIKLHTAQHLLLAALQEVLGKDVKQRGSNITSKRLRMDFSHDKKLSDEEKQRVEDIVNEKIREGLDLTHEEIPREEAEKLSAEMEFGTKYGDTVSVYIIKNKEGDVFSIEFCGGPHVKNTDELGKFEIKKEKAVSVGIRRIRATLTI
jgi:alanyl-tRNA synthetase